jgi:cupin superfamily acireductone dioxygenase involved in methionine salvage
MSAKITKIESYNAEQDFNRLPKNEKTATMTYKELVEQLIRKRYSFSDEIAIIRQQNSKYTEFLAYNEYAEQCKAKAKEILGI